MVRASWGSPNTYKPLTMNNVLNIKNKSLKRQDSEKDTKNPPEISLNDLTQILQSTLISHKKQLIRDTIYTFCISENLPISKLNIKNHFLELKNKDGSQRFSTSSSKSKTKTYLLKNPIFEPEAPYFFTDEFIQQFNNSTEKHLRDKEAAENIRRIEIENIARINEQTNRLSDNLKHLLSQQEIKKKIMQSINTGIKNQKRNSDTIIVDIDFNDIFDYDFSGKDNVRLTDIIINNPYPTLKIITEILNENIKIPTQSSSKFVKGKIKNNEIIYLKFHPRLINTPPEAEYELREITENELHKLVSFKAMVLKIAEPEIKTLNGFFKCNRCGSTQWQKQKRLVKTIITPKHCRSCDRKDFTLIESQSENIRVQFMQVQEVFESEKNYSMPKTLDIYLAGDLVNSIEPGTDVIINGIPQIFTIKRGVKKMVVDVVSIQKAESDDNLTDDDISTIEKFIKEHNPEDIMDYLSDNFAKNVYGYDELKKLLILYAAGGNDKMFDESNNHLRGTVHGLLVGNPGTAKTILLKEVAKISPTSYYADQKTTTEAGLTAAVINDKEYGSTLSFGTVFKATRIMLDEIDKAPDHSALNTPMESQEVPINKAGFNRKFKLNFGLLAAANPKNEKFDLYAEIYKQIDISPATLSRFDFIVILKTPEVEHQKKIRNKQSAVWTGKKSTNHNKTDQNLKFIKKLIIYSQRFNPTISPLASKILNEYTDVIIGQDTHAIMERTINSLCRLTSAYARINFRKRATKQDAQNVVKLFDYFFRKIATDKNGEFDPGKIYGISKSNRQKIQAIEEIIKELSTPENKYLAPIDEILKMTDIPKDEFNELIIEMKKKGTIMEPKLGELKINPY